MANLSGLVTSQICHCSKKAARESAETKGPGRVAYDLTPENMGGAEKGGCGPGAVLPAPLLLRSKEATLDPRAFVPGGTGSTECRRRPPKAAPDPGSSVQAPTGPSQREGCEGGVLSGS